MSSSAAAKPRGHTLNHWQLELQLQSLPARADIKKEALEKMSMICGNAKNVAAIIEYCPILSLQLFCETNRKLSNLDSHCQSLEHAIALLGFPRVEAILRRTKEANQKTVGKYLPEYQQAQATSQHAAFQMRSWIAINPHWHAWGHILYWATLFQRAPLWALWIHDGETIQALELCRAQHNGANNQQTQQECLGVSIDHLCQALARQWKLPGLCIESWQAKSAGDARQWIELANKEQHNKDTPYFCHHPAFAVALANQLADEADWAWDSSKTLRIMKCLATALCVPHAIDLCHRNAAGFSQKTGHTTAADLLGGYQKAVDILSRQRSEEEHAVPVVQPQRNINQISTPAQTNDNTFNRYQAETPSNESPSAQVQTLPQREETSLLNVLTQLKKHPETFDDHHAAIKLVMQTLRKQLKMTQVIGVLYNASIKELNCVHSSNSTMNPDLKTFRHTVKNKDFFSMLLQKPISFQLHKGNYKKFWPLLPQTFRNAIHANQFFIMSIFLHGKPFAILYADKAGTHTDLTADEYLQFKQLCSALSHCITDLSPE